MKLSRKKLIGGIGIGILLFVGYSINTMYTQSKAQRLQNTSEMQFDALPIDPKQRMETLVNMLPTLPKQFRTVALWQIANDALIVDKPMAVHYFETLAKEKIQPIAYIAQLTKAQLLIAQNKAQEAITLLSAIKTFVSPEIEQIYLITLAQAQEETKNVKQALQTYKKIASLNGPMQRYATFRVAQLSAQQ